MPRLHPRAVIVPNQTRCYVQFIAQEQIDVRYRLCAAHHIQASMWGQLGDAKSKPFTTPVYVVLIGRPFIDKIGQPLADVVRRIGEKQVHGSIRNFGAQHFNRLSEVDCTISILKSHSSQVRSCVKPLVQPRFTPTHMRILMLQVIHRHGSRQTVQLQEARALGCFASAPLPQPHRLIQTPKTFFLQRD